MEKIGAACGRHVTLADNPEARVSRCPCGTIHVLVKGSGLTVQLAEERFQQLGLAVMGAVSALGNTTSDVPASSASDPSFN